MLFRLHYSVQKAQQPDWLTGYECERPVKRRDRRGCLAAKNVSVLEKSLFLNRSLQMKFRKRNKKNGKDRTRNKVIAENQRKIPIDCWKCLFFARVQQELRLQVQTGRMFFLTIVFTLNIYHVIGRLVLRNTTQSIHE